jgi:hypothetical protein
VNVVSLIELDLDHRGHAAAGPGFALDLNAFNGGGVAKSLLGAGRERNQERHAEGKEHFHKRRSGRVLIPYFVIGQPAWTIAL